jgi:hypothetical protein
MIYVIMGLGAAILVPIVSVFLVLLGLGSVVETIQRSEESTEQEDEEWF